MVTRFRAYNMGNAGSSYSYFDGSDFLLFEARYNEYNMRSISHEINQCGLQPASNGKFFINLHITSYDKDHCNFNELSYIFDHFNVNNVDLPGYYPHSEEGKMSKRYVEISTLVKTHKYISPNYLSALNSAPNWGTGKVIFWPREISSNPNDNSTVMLFRSGHFSILSTGDIEDREIGKRIMGDIASETDVLILPHHGSYNSMIDDDFLDSINPNVAICNSDYNNQYGHPHDTIRNMLRYKEIPLCTTKRGDVIIESYGDLTTVYDYALSNDRYIPQKRVTFYPKKRYRQNITGRVDGIW